MIKVQPPDNIVTPLVILGHQGTLPTVPTQTHVDEMLGIVDDGSRCNKEMAVVSDTVFHEATMLEMGIE